MGGLDTRQFEELQRQLDRLARRTPQIHRELLNDVADYAMDNVVSVVPEDEGRLKASFKRVAFRGKEEWIKKLKGNDIIEIGTTVYYAHMVEDGHFLIKINKKTDSIGRTRKTKKVLGFVSGKHYFKRAMETTKIGLNNKIEQLLAHHFRRASFSVSG